jgi:hypothetical protein
MYHYMVGRSVLLVVELLKDTDFDGTVHQGVIVARNADRLFDLARRCVAKYMNIAGSPARRYVKQPQAHALCTCRRRVHQHHRPVEKRMF